MFYQKHQKTGGYLAKTLFYSMTNQRLIFTGEIFPILIRSQTS